MKKYRVVLVGTAEMFFGKQVFDEKHRNETYEQYDVRTAPKKVHVEDGTNHVFVQPFALKNGLESAAKRISKPIPGQGKATYSKLFRQGIIVLERAFLFKEDMETHIKLTDIQYIKMSVPSNGVRGSGKRVTKTFPFLNRWVLVGTIHVSDMKITADILEEHLNEMGQYIGIGSLRVENGGVAGRFEVSAVTQIVK